MDEDEEIPSCTAHRKPMEPWQFRTSAISYPGKEIVIVGFKCGESNCPVVYSEALQGYCTVDAEGTPIPFQKRGSS
jgi:hypothetical protein